MNRIYGKRHNISLQKIKTFFDNQIANNKGMYAANLQNDNPALPKMRDVNEKQTIIPLLQIKDGDKILDLGCGTGRWAENCRLKDNIYLGVDYSLEAINFAKKHFIKDENITFKNANVIEFIKFSKQQGYKYDCCLISALLMYINDSEVIEMLDNMQYLLNSNARVYIKETVSIVDKRITLNNFYSHELHSNYNAIYRTELEYLEILKQTILKNGDIYLKNSAELLTCELKNRKETTQHYYLLEKK